MPFGMALGTLALIGLASLFLALRSPGQGLIGLVILFVGLRIAWRLTGGKPINIVGPLKRTHCRDADLKRGACADRSHVRRPPRAE